MPPFTSAGGHFNPTGAGHGDHAGDLLSLLVDRDDTAPGFVVQEHLERLIGTGSIPADLEPEPTFLVGLGLQPPSRWRRCC